MKLPRLKLQLLTSALTLAVSMPVWSLPVFINEIHYDNSGSDVNEGVELLGLAGTNLNDWQLLFYNGSNGNVYNTVNLQGVIAEQQLGYGTAAFSIAGLQNGAPDGVALVDNNNNVLQFLSYEGVLTANNGAASGLQSRDIGISEPSSSASDGSVQLFGQGLDWLDFDWRYGQSSFGEFNLEQMIVNELPEPLLPLDGAGGEAAVPEPGTLGLLSFACLCLGLLRRYKIRSEPLLQAV